MRSHSSAVRNLQNRLSMNRGMDLIEEAKALVTETWRGWNDDDAMQWSAALSFYAALALAPLLVTLLALAGTIFDQQVVQQRLLAVLAQQVGPQAAELARSIVYDQEGGVLAGAWSGLLVLAGATAVFGQLQKALNEVWQVRAGGGIRRMLQQRLLGMAMVLVIGLLFLGALALQALVTALPDWAPLSLTANLGASAVLFTLLSAAVYQILPDADIRWRDVWIGAAVTAVLFSLGQLALGIYLGRSSVGSSYGAAGSLVAVLLWLYYSGMAFFFGAEFTQVWARRRGRRITPTRGAHRVETRKVLEASVASSPGRTETAPYSWER